MLARRVPALPWLSLPLLLLTLAGCDSGDDEDAPSLVGLWEFVAPAGLPDQPFFVRIAAAGDGYRSETWNYFEAPDACFFRDESEDARLEPLGGDRYRVTEGGDVSEVTITVSGETMTVRNGGFSSQFARSTRSLAPVCDEEPGGGGEGRGPAPSRRR